MISDSEGIRERADLGEQVTSDPIRTKDPVSQLSGSAQVPETPIPMTVCRDC